jgi:hypothetical protein
MNASEPLPSSSLGSSGMSHQEMYYVGGAILLLLVIVIIYFVWRHYHPKTPASTFLTGGNNFLAVSDQLAMNPDAQISTTSANLKAVFDRHEGRAFNMPHKLPPVNPGVADEMESGTLLGMDYQSQLGQNDSTDYDSRLASLARQDAVFFDSYGGDHLHAPTVPLASAAQQTAQQASSASQAVKKAVQAAQSTGAHPTVVAALQSAQQAASQAAQSAAATTKSVAAQ